MDVDDAIGLLAGGQQGVRKWNALRSTGGEVPSLVDAQLPGATMAGADLSGAALGGANLEGADLSRANLSGAQLQGVNLAGANLNEANLSGTDLDAANLTGADLRGASLDGALLSGVLGITQAQVDTASGNAETRLPDGLDAPGRWKYASHNPYSVF